MKNRQKTILIILIYLFSLSIYIGMSYLTHINMMEHKRIFNKLNIPSRIDSYNQIYLSLYFVILSTFFMIKSLKLFSIPKIIDIVVFIIAYTSIGIAIYKFYTINEFIDMLLIANGLVLMLNFIHKRNI
ncbi:hypothetical protein BX659_1606 [Orenia metallireducens]|uniref:Uncharacterized protein n=1 Tax=Orenia metallireducens TaxID=1413210 RepID=A0A285IL86_9FIRM|nr:hypothetical protein [Orenia metallireducens]PRX16925.1 hypothetical protein BX659_1606 [Orenia metallireducens]SNY47866.1 hypothetical protein SAMN06265827_1606 [Orenia metallireducens]